MSYLAPQTIVTPTLASVQYTPCDCDIMLNTANLRLRIQKTGDADAPVLVYDGATVTDGVITFPLDSLIQSLADGYYTGRVEQAGTLVGVIEFVKLPRRSGPAAVALNCGA